MSVHSRQRSLCRCRICAAEDIAKLRWRLELEESKHVLLRFRTMSHRKMNRQGRRCDPFLARPRSSWSRPAVYRFIYGRYMFFITTCMHKTRIDPWMHPSIHLSIHPAIIHPSVRPSVRHPSIHPSITCVHVCVRAHTKHKTKHVCTRAHIDG